MVYSDPPGVLNESRNLCMPLVFYHQLERMAPYMQEYVILSRETETCETDIRESMSKLRGERTESGCLCSGSLSEVFIAACGAEE
jgi:hypothetical protein